MQSKNINKEITICNKIQDEFEAFISAYSDKKIFILTDENSFNYCFPLIEKFPLIKSAKRIQIKSGEENKNIQSITKIWDFLSEQHADRHSILINLGGGVICDMGGFAASTFKRGIDFINMPTTLLSQVDASIGGKTGFNLSNVKNEIGVFSNPFAIFICTEFLKTLKTDELKSGFGEMLKHALIFDEKHWTDLKKVEFSELNLSDLKTLISRSIEIKNHFVKSDPYEKNIRKALNFGHTIGHALETFFLNKNIHVSHGKAVGLGMIAESYLSYKNTGLASSKLYDIKTTILSVFGLEKLNKNEYPILIELMKHDKKNQNNSINFTLLSDIGHFTINHFCSENEILEALEFVEFLS